MGEMLLQGVNGSNNLLLEEWPFQSDDDNKEAL